MLRLPSRIPTVAEFDYAYAQLAETRLESQQALRETQAELRHVEAVLYGLGVGACILVTELAAGLLLASLMWFLS